MHTGIYTATENTVKHCENIEGTINSLFATHYFTTRQHQRKQDGKHPFTIEKQFD